jgi:pyrroline-5-carboxylate reductase
MSVVVIGIGSIGSAVAKGLLQSGYRIIAAEKSFERRKEIEKLGLTVTDDNKWAAREADIIILCVKPKDVEEVLKEIRNEIKGKIIISMAAALNLDFLKKLAPESKFVRAMPNVTILVRESFTAYCVESNIAIEEKEKADKLLRAFGEVVEIDEAQMDAITALSGCAPAYLSVILEAMTYAGLGVGLTKDLALSASAKAMIGTGKLILEAKKTPSEIKDMVTTPGGVTIEGLRELEKIPIRHAMMNAIVAAATKSKIISESFTKKYD